MAIVLLRVDERLIHGQVVLGWGNQLRPDHYVVVDDGLAQSEWEQELYQLALPADTEVAFVTVEQARVQIPALESEGARAVVLMRGVRAAHDLALEGVLEGLELNLGGLHHKEGCTRCRGYIHLSEEDQRMLKAIGDRGVTVSGQDLPASPKVLLAELLG